MVKSCKYSATNRRPKVSVKHLMYPRTNPAQTAISTLPIVASVTQLGIRLRVLIPDSIGDALEQVRRVLAAQNIEADTQVSHASLEDVFVAVTLDAPERAA